ncbi:MAG: hypothetical protein M3072_17470 [Candidatus Dormibacteraeota bacterium]|nr:hypothetical protein [Candidatus Dormibacteraeota bacterium]
MERRRLIAAALVVAAVLGAASRLWASNPNSGLLVLAGAACAGGGLLAASHEIGPRLGLPQLGQGRSLLVIAGSLTALAVPWQTQIPPAHLDRLFGWQTPAAWIFVAALIAGTLVGRPRVQGIALTLAGTALAAWVVWLGHLLLTPEVTRLGFPFQVVDLLAVGWYLAVITFLIAAEAEAARRSEDEGGPARLPELLVWSFLPGLGLVRSGRRPAGLAWLGAGGVVGFLLWLSAYGQDQFLYWSTFSYTVLLPPARSRGDVTALLWLLALLLVTSFLSTLWAARGERQPRRQLESWTSLGQAGEPDSPRAPGRRRS